MRHSWPSLSAAACAVLSAPDPAEKLRLSHAIARLWRDGRIPGVGTAAAPQRPARPARPELKAPGRVPRRRITRGLAGRGALLHAIAHIELNAIDLAWDLIARFAGGGLPRAFADDWVAVAEEEARHFALLAQRLGELGLGYGDLPAHDGLWEAADATSHDLLARLAVVPLVLEARGLDVTPSMIAKLKAVGDARSAAILQTVYEDEIGHVAVGKRWFDHVASKRGLDAGAAWRDLVRRHFKGALKPPFNHAARLRAGLPPQFYDPTGDGPDA